MYRKCSNSHVIPNHPFRMALIGPSMSGKTHLAKTMLTDKRFYKNYFDSIIILTTTPHQGVYREIQRANNAREQHVEVKLLDFDYLAKLFAVLKGIRDEIPPEEEEERLPHLNTTLILIDDPSRNSMKHPMMEPLFKSSRHFGVSVMLITQSFKDVPFMCRSSISHYALFSQSEENLRKFWEAVGVFNIKPKRFLKWVEGVYEQQYGFVYYNNSKKVKEGRFSNGWCHPWDGTI